MADEIRNLADQTSSLTEEIDKLVIELEKNAIVTQKVVNNVVNSIDDENETIIEVKFNGGCSGNTQAISQLIKGMKISEVIEKLGKIKCGSKNTSCGKELCKGLIREMM